MNAEENTYFRGTLSVLLAHVNLKTIPRTLSPWKFIKTCSLLLFAFRFKVKRGFTLIEFLVVLGVLAITVGSALLVLTSVLRGTNQANITAEVKQNGQVVLDTLESHIRNATSAVALPSGAVAGAPSAVALTLSDGSYLFLACFNTVGTSSNGWIGSVGPVNSNSVPSPGSFIPLTNRDTTSGVDVGCNSPCPTNCTFSVIAASAGTANPAIVMVSFAANQGVAAPSRQDFRANVRFETTISLRRY